MITLRIPPLAQPQRLDAFLASWPIFFEATEATPSRSEIARRIEAGSILLSNVPAKPSSLVEGDETITFERNLFQQKEEILKAEPDLPLRIVFENDAFLVIDKPAGIDTHPSTTKRTGTVVNWLIARFPSLPYNDDPNRPGIVHRLDRDTSGLLIIGKTPDVLQEFKQLFQNRAIQKTYLTLIASIPKEKEGVITAPIARSTKGGKQAVPHEKTRTKGTLRPAETHYRVIKSFKNTALVEAKPKTGRTHQIRVHFASIGHPILGDTLYGGKANKHTPFPRQLLHAVRLSFSFRGHHFDFESPLPLDFQHALDYFQASSRDERNAR